MRDKKLKYLVICESPAKTSHLQEYIKAGGYTVSVMASVGHISEIKNGGTYYNTGIEPTQDFKMSLGIADDKKKVVDKLLEKVEWADHVVLATDGDNEGAQISWSLIKFLKLKKGTYTRMITHEITPKAVLKAFENPVEMDTNNAMASQARMCLDKMMGYRISTIVRDRIGARSAGRCQSIGLKLLVDREREIQNFIPETYFDLYVNFKKNNTIFKAKFVGSDTLGVIEHLKTEKDVEAVKALCTKDYTIKDIIKKEKQESPKPPFTTPNFQQEVASKLGLSVADAMSCAQKLFEGGYCTYLRTDDDSISPEFLPVLEEYVKSTYGADAWNLPRVGKKTGDEQAGHECFRITDPTMTPEKFAKKELNTLLQKVYKLVWQRTIATCLPNAIFSETSYSIINNNQNFLLISKELIKEGYKTVYSYKDDEEEDNETVRETFEKGEKLQNPALTQEKKVTRPPQRFNEASLVKKLQTTGVGRPSTYATIVETVLSDSRGYATKENKLIVPTAKGMKLSEFLDEKFPEIINLNYSKDLEVSLDSIASGKTSNLAFLTKFYNDLEESAKKVEEDVPKCPNCGRPLVKRFSVKTKKTFWACSGYPECTYILKNQ